MPKHKPPPKNNARLKKVGAAGIAVGRWLLDFIDAMAELMPNPIETPYAHIRRLNGWHNELPRHRVCQEVVRMKDCGWIEEAHEQGKKFLRLTKKGKLKLFYQRMHDCKPPAKNAWDGKWWCALFDIPEQGRSERDAIRKALRLAGFYRLQKSVYVFPSAIPEAVTAYLKEANLLLYIRFVRIDRMDVDENMRNHFPLIL